MATPLHVFPRSAVVLAASLLLAVGLPAQNLGSEGGGGRSFSDFEFDIAYDASTGVFCETYFGGGLWAAAFQGTFPATPQRPTSGSSFGLRRATGSLDVQGARVANCASTDQFLIVWQERASGGDWDVWGAVLDASSAFPGPWAFSSAPFPIANQPGIDEVTPDVGGDVTANPGQATVVWAEGPVGAAATELRASVVDLSVVPAVPGAAVTIFNAVPPDLPAITKSGGAARRHFVSFRVAGVGLAVLALDPSANVVGAAVPAFTGTQTNFVGCDIAGDGTAFTIVAEVLESAMATDRDIVSSHGTWSGSAIQIVDSATVSAVPGIDENDPSIARLDSKYTAAFTLPNGGAPTTGASNAALNVPGSDVVVQNLQLASAAPCGNPLVLAQGNTQINFSPAVGSRLSGGQVGTDEGLFVRRRQNSDAGSGTSGNGTPRATFLQTFRGGAVVTLPNTGLCAAGAIAGTRGAAAVGNQNFALTLTGADPQAAGAAVIIGDGASPPVAICGVGCGDLIVPQGIAFVPLTNGASDFPLPIPCVNAFSGGQAYAQWVTLGPATPGTCAGNSGVRPSPALAITVDN